MGSEIGLFLNEIRLTNDQKPERIKSVNVSFISM